VVHTEPPLRVLRSATHSGPGQAWTVEYPDGGNPLVMLADAGIEIRGHIRARSDIARLASPRVREHADGWRWDSWRSGLRLTGVPDGRVQRFRVGSTALRGPAAEVMAMGTAATADRIGKA